MIKTTGLDKLAKKMDRLARFAEEVDGELATVSIDPNDPSSIEGSHQ